MVTVSKVVDGLLNDSASSVYTAYEYIGVGTGTAQFNDDDVNLNAGVEIDSVGGFRKIRETGSTGSFLSGRSMVMLFTLDSGEPTVQPVNIGEVGLFKNNGSDDGLGVGAKLNVVQTKDSLVKQRWRLSLRFNRVSEV